jgi:glycosyltransferase involved in cell wall biosynthesis
LRIAITVDPYYPVPPKLYGGIERVVDLLARRLVKRGHEVTLFAHPESQTEGRLIPYGSPPHFGARHRLAETWQVGATLWRHRREFDLIHSFGRLQALLPVLPLRWLPKVQSYQRAIPWRGVKTAARLAGASLWFTGCTASLYRDRPRHGVYGGCWRCVFNGVDTDKYEFVPRVPVDAPLVFLGRLEPIKGAHHAIRIARAAGRRLILAGNRVRTGPAAPYFEREIAGHVDGTRVVYAGTVDDVQKNRLLGAAAALLMPVEWEEPFGIVMAEALACGTPVIGFARGSVPEVVRDGVNGYLCSTVGEAVAAVGRLGRIGREAVRADCEARFGGDTIAEGYEQLYEEMVCR